MENIDLFWLVLGGVTIGGAFMAVARADRDPPDARTPTAWQFYRVLPFGKVRLKDGSVATFNELVMRRRLADGLWEYRRPTEAEAYEEWIDSQW